MKKKLISAAILLGVSTLAFADDSAPMQLNKDGLGQVLLYPYYNVNDGFDTAFTVVNTSGTYRAVKVRFFEGKNSWEVLDFNLYMSPNDTWQGMLHRDGDKVVVLTSDTSCTIPILNNPKKPAYLRPSNITEVEGKQVRDISLFTGKRYKTQDQREAEYADPANLLKRISEGYVEVIDMGAILQKPGKDDITANNYKAYAAIIDHTPTGTADEQLASTKEAFKDFYGKEGKLTALLAGIRHENGVPGDCSKVSDFMMDTWKDKPDLFIYNDGENALTGFATMINVGKGHAGSYNAVAIKNFVVKDNLKDAEGATGGNANARVYPTAEDQLKAYTLHNLPSSSYPNINGQVQRTLGDEGIVIYSEAINPDVLITHNGGGQKTIKVNKALFDNVQANTYLKLENSSYALKGLVRDTGDPELAPAAVSVSAILMAKDVIGEYVIDPNLRAASDWVLSMPTKHYFTNADTTQPNDNMRGIGQYGFINDYRYKLTDGTLSKIKDDGSAATELINDHLVKELGSNLLIEPRTVKSYIKAYRPFTNTAFHRANPLVETASMVVYNREEGETTMSYEFDFSPSLGVPDTGINSEANVLHFSKDSVKKIFTSMNEHMLDVKKDFAAGWAKVSFNEQFLSDATIGKVSEQCQTDKLPTADDNKATYCLRGLPVIGIAATKYVNSILYIDGVGDVLSNYMGIVDLTYKRDNTVTE